MFLCYEHPDKHPFISDDEKSFLKDKTFGYLEANRENVPSTPWKEIVTNTPVIALLVSSVSLTIDIVFQSFIQIKFQIPFNFFIQIFCVGLIQLGILCCEHRSTKVFE